MNRRTSAVLLAVITIVSACSDDDGATPRADPSPASGAEAASPIVVTAIDYEFEGLPATVAAGSTLELANESSREVHELVALRLPDEEGRSVEELTALPPAEFEALFAGPPAAVLVAPPGEGSFVAAGDTVAEPGRYLFMCFIPTGADPQSYLDALEANPGVPPEVPGGAPHFTAGMVEEVSVR